MLALHIHSGQIASLIKPSPHELQMMALRDGAVCSFVCLFVYRQWSLLTTNRKFYMVFSKNPLLVT